MNRAMQDPAWPEPTGWPSDVTRDRLIGDVHLYQRRGGHRTSTDDVVTAWFASKRFARAPERYLDLGCGVGSVLLMTVHRLRPLSSVGVEAQPQSVEMAQRSVAELPEGMPEIIVKQADFRDPHFVDGTFDLVTGSPPYFPLSDGVLPADAQRRACRFEARGGVEAYCDAAARAMASEGAFYLVFQTTWDARVLAAARAAQLHLTARVDFRMRVDRPGPFLTVYEFRKQTSEVACVELSVRDVDGAFTAEYETARAELGVA